MAEVKKKKPGPKPAPRKTKILIKAIAEGKIQKDAAKLAGYSPTYANELLKKPEVQLKIQDLMEGMGLGDGNLLMKHRELLNAQKQISGVKDADGGSMEFIEVPDYPTQMKALETAYKLKGAFVEKKEITGANGTALFDPSSVLRVARLIVDSADGE